MASPMGLNLILEKIASKDKDFRYMATSDLLNELQKPTFRTEAGTEQKVSELILQQLEDVSGDISALAVKCLALLTRKISDQRLEAVVGSLCSRLVDGKKEQQREVAAIGLKAVVAEVSGAGKAAIICRQAMPVLIRGVQQVLPKGIAILLVLVLARRKIKAKTKTKRQDSAGMANECLEIMHEVIVKHGGLITDHHAELVRTLLPLLQSGRSLLRKRTTQCLASLTVFVSDDLLNHVSSSLLKELAPADVLPETARTFVHALSAVSRAVGYRFAGQLPTAVPLAIHFVAAAAEDDQELMECGLQALEAFVARTPHETRGYLDRVVPVAVRCLSHDPNYQDDMEEDGGDDELEDDGDLDDEDFEDEDDASWKVRRAAAKLLSAVLLAWPGELSRLYPSIAPVLVSRFREREENVKGDVFAAFCDLLRQVAIASRRFEGVQASRPVELLRADMPLIMRAAVQQLRDKSLKTRTGAFHLLRELVALLPAEVGSHAASLVPGIQGALQDKSATASSLKIQALQFLRAALSNAGPAQWQPHLAALSTPVFAAASERYYKVSAEALRAAEAMVHALRPDCSQPAMPGSQGIVGKLHSCVMARLAAQDQDQEVKEAAISVLAALVATCGDQLGGEVPGVAKALLERLQNEITRLTAVKAFAVLARSPLRLDLVGVLEPTLSELTGFLRKANRALRQAALTAIEALIAQYGGAVSPAALATTAAEVAQLVSDADLLITALALSFYETLVRQQPSQAEAASQRVLSNAMALAQSPLLQGQALQALQSFFVALAASGVPSGRLQTLLASLLAAGQDASAGRAAQQNIAQCVAVLCRAAGPAATNSTVQQVLGAVQAKNEGQARLALFTLGAIGRSVDLSKFGELAGALTSSLASPSEDIKGAASLALGGVAIGALSSYLPFLLQQINQQGSNPKEQYLLLKALNETIVTLATGGGGGAQLSDAQQGQVLQLLLGCVDAEEECTHVVAACLGHLALLHPGKLLPVLLKEAQSKDDKMRTVVVTALRSCVTDQPHPIDEQLHSSMGSMLGHIQDPSRHVRRAAVQTLSTAAHNKPGLIVDHLPSLLPKLYEQTKVDPSLIREVDLGPFKHRIDDGLELRKAAFECMDLLLDACPDCIHFPTFIEHLQAGLQDHYDIKLPCHLLLGRLATAAGADLLPALPRLTGPLEHTLTVKIKGEPVKQEVDRNEDMIRSCLRAILAVSSIRGAESSAAWQQFMQKAVLAGATGAKYAAIREEQQERMEGLEGMEAGLH